MTHHTTPSTDALDVGTHRYVYDRATDAGGIRDQPLGDYIDDVVEDIIESEHWPHDAADEPTLRQAALEAAADATRALAHDGYFEHF